MKYLHVGQLLTAIKSANGNITIGRQYKIKKIQKIKSTVTGIIIDLDHLKDYLFDQGTFIYYFGDHYFIERFLNKNITVL